MSDRHERTEEATPRRRTRASAEGQSAQSAAMTAALTIGGAALPALTLLHSADGWRRAIRESAELIIAHADRTDAGSLVHFAFAFAPKALLPLVVAGAVAALSAAGSSAMCGALTFAGKALRLKLNRLSWAAGVRQLLSRATLAHAAVVALWLAMGCGAAAMAALKLIGTTPLVTSITACVEQMRITIEPLWLPATAGALLLGLADVVMARRRLAAALRMTPREVRDERAQFEGKPEVRARRRAVAAKKSRGLRLRAIARATAVIANPTHVAVALRYAPPAIDVPIVVSRGADLAATAVRTAAHLYDVPIVESPELARELFRVDLDEPIPEECYAAVAVIFAWLIRTRGRLQGEDAA